jgi:chromosome segregation ATPase
MSYGELAAVRGIDRTSALKLALRHKWRKQTDNRGTVRVLVPTDWAAPADKRAAAGAEMSTAITALEAAIAALREQAQTDKIAIGTLREQLGTADFRADRAEAGRERADQALVGERARADTLRDRIEALQVQLAARQEVVDAAEAIRQADDRRRALGRWARLRAAWRGE